MFKNYFKIAWRNLIKNKTFSLINILGLSLGMACSVLIMLWVKDELKMDRFHEAFPVTLLFLPFLFHVSGYSGSQHLPPSSGQRKLAFVKFWTQVSPTW